MFFLATVDAAGQPTCSYKGGDPGFVSVIDDRTLAFPNYDGNGMYLSMGNVRETRGVGLLFIDFEGQRRLRVDGTAELVTDHPLLARYEGAQFMVLVGAARVYPNCPRYIHKYELAERSTYVPRAGGPPPIPAWKQSDWASDVLPASDPARGHRPQDAIVMSKYRNALPQLAGNFFMTDGGIETTLIFLEGQELSVFRGVRPPEVGGRRGRPPEVLRDLRQPRQTVHDGAHPRDRDVASQPRLGRETGLRSRRPRRSKLEGGAPGRRRSGASTRRTRHRSSSADALAPAAMATSPTLRCRRRTPRTIIACRSTPLQPRRLTW